MGVPLKPGVKEEEQEQLENLRWWSDAKGEGWIAKGPSMGTLTKDKWFSVKTCGSWRLSFLMARLQRDVWLSGMHIEAAIQNFSSSWLHFILSWGPAPTLLSMSWLVDSKGGLLASM